MTTIDPFIQDIIARETDMLAWLGFTVEEASAGVAKVSVTVAEAQGNANAMAHGGVIFALADHAFAMCATTVLGYSATTDAYIQYLAPGRVGETLTAEAGITFSDERRAVVDVKVMSGETVIATYRGSARALRNR